MPQEAQAAPAPDPHLILVAKSGEVIGDLLAKTGRYRPIRCLAKRPYFQTWQGHASTWYAKEADNTDVVLKVYDTVLTFWLEYGSSWDVVDVRSDVADYCQRFEAQFQLQGSASLSPWLRYHQDDRRGLLVICRPYYPCPLAEHFASGAKGSDWWVPVGELLPSLYEIAGALDRLTARGIVANVSANNLFIHNGNVVITDWDTGGINDLIRQHDAETKIVKRDDPNAEERFPNFKDLREGRAFMPLSSASYKLAKTYFFLRTGHHLRQRADLERLTEAQEQEIVMQALSEENAFPSCNAFVSALERVNPRRR
jgi:hypothetical protein